MERYMGLEPAMRKRLFIVVGSLAIAAVFIFAANDNKPERSTNTNLANATKPSAVSKTPSNAANAIVSSKQLPSTAEKLNSPAAKSEVKNENYPTHSNITATVFWAGEPGDADNDYITNVESYWTSDWLHAFGGVDDPNNRCGYRPCAFTPRENPFYFALPYGEFDNNGNLKPASELRRIPWYTGSVPQDTSLLKNRWVQISHGGKVAYAQWEDVGPFGEDDINYVFGSAEPKEKRAGIDLSPATANYLGVDGRGKVDWKFVEEGAVPPGPWTEIITRSNPS